MNARWRTMPYSCSWTSKKRLLANDFVHGGPKKTRSWTTVHWGVKKVVAEQVKNPLHQRFRWWSGFFTCSWTMLCCCWWTEKICCLMNGIVKILLMEGPKTRSGTTIHWGSKKDVQQWVKKALYQRFRWWSGFFYLLMNDVKLLWMIRKKSHLMNSIDHSV